jgi:hypothetical protein
LQNFKKKNGQKFRVGASKGKEDFWQELRFPFDD